MRLLNYLHQPEESEAYEVEQNYLEKWQVDGQKYSDDCKDKKCFVVDGRKQAFCEKHEDDKRQKRCPIKPHEIPLQKQSNPNQ
jgi:hypothetical protein